MSSCKSVIMIRRATATDPIARMLKTEARTRSSLSPFITYMHSFSELVMHLLNIS